MAPIVLDLAAKRATTFVEISYGSPVVFQRYTDADEDTVFETNTYTSRPSLEVTIPPYTGMLTENSPIVIIPLAVSGVIDTFVDEISNGRAFAPMTVRVVVSLEADPPGPIDRLQELFKGVVTITIRNHQGRLDQVALKCVTFKQESDRPCGLQANPQCYYRFQGRGCVVDSPPGSMSYISAVTPVLPATRSPTVLSIVRDLLTLTAAPTGGPFTDTLFHRGFFERNGLEVGIREWAFGAPAVFLMERPPPAEWVGNTVTLHQGCDKTILTCANRYSNDSFFGGFGVGIRDYNPVFEVRD